MCILVHLTEVYAFIAHVSSKLAGLQGWLHREVQFPILEAVTPGQHPRWGVEDAEREEERRGKKV